MAIKNTIIVLVLFLTFFANCWAQDYNIFTFSSAAKEQTFKELTEQLRCLVCQNETLADSTAGLAKDLRLQIYQQIQQGKNSEQIKSYLVSRYGEFILFKPAFNPATYVLWSIPFLLFLTVFIVLYRLKAKSNKKSLLP